MRSIWSRRECLALAAALPLTPFAIAQTVADPVDARLGPAKTLNDNFPFTVPKTLAHWQARRQRLREQVQVALGLFPMPARPAVNAVIGKHIERDGYTVEHVRFESMPGHFVTGSLYRPTGDAQRKRPGVLFAHGHWAEGRLHVESDAAAKKLVDSGAEPDLDTAKFFMQHLPALFARHGIVVFAFDMVGYAESTAIGHVAKSGVPHVNGFASVDCELHGHSLMGLQILNCIRSLDFLQGLPEVDATSLGMTGASGGGTQTFITAALDERIAVAAPAVMVSTAMQGGCVCENCSGLRVGTGNVEIAALIAPRPLALTAANDWTKELLTKGYPELQKLYDMHGKKDCVCAKAWPEFPHNYNFPARRFVLGWFLKHFELDRQVHDFAFKSIPIEELKSPFTGMPSNAATVHETWKTLDRDALAKATPAITTKALRAMVCDELPANIAIRKGPIESKVDGCTVHRAWLGRTDEQDAVPVLGMFTKAFTGAKVLVWIHPEGKESLFAEGKVVTAARAMLDAGFAIVSADLLGTGALKIEKSRPVNPIYAGFTWGYNRTVLAERVHDVLTMLAFAKTMLKAKTIDLVGWKDAGPWAALAAALAGDTITRCAVDANGFNFARLKDFNDPMMLPGVMKYGGLPAMLEAIAATTLVHNTGKAFSDVRTPLKDSYHVKPLEDKDITEWLLKSE